MWKNNSLNRGQGLIGIIIVLAVVGLFAGGLYYYLSKQIPEVPKISEKPAEEVVKPEEEIVPPPEKELPKEEIAPEETIEEKPVVSKCADGTLYGQCSTNKPKYCHNGVLIDKASLCGCPFGYKTSDNRCILDISIKYKKIGIVYISESNETYNAN